MTEIEAIKERHSVRNYLDKKIEQDKIDKLNELISKCNEEGNIHLEFCADAGNTYTRLLNKAMGLASAPGVIVCMGAEDDTLEERIGYYGQKLVLFAQSLGLNTCWTGTFNKNGVPVEINPGEKIIITIAIGYGATQGNKRRSKSVNQVTSGNNPEWFNYGVEMALLAPTAINQQKFEIKLATDGNVIFKDKGGPYSKVDLGIVKYHFEVGVAAKKQEE